MTANKKKLSNNGPNNSAGIPLPSLFSLSPAPPHHPHHHLPSSSPFLDVVGAR